MKELAYIAIQPNGEYCYSSLSDEEDLTIEHVTYNEGSTIEELIMEGWKFTEVTIQR